MALVIGWLIPGASFMLCGRWTRGILHFVTIMVTFALGLALHSGVAWPSWSPKSEEFNLINNFTFIVQMGSGLPALGSLMASLSRAASASSAWPLWLAGEQKHPYYELGSYFLIVAGALNYFVVGNFYDRVIKIQSRFRPQELGEEEVAG